MESGQITVLEGQCSVIVGLRPLPSQNLIIASFVTDNNGQPRSAYVATTTGTTLFFAPRLSERKARRDGTGKLEIGKKLQAGGRKTEMEDRYSDEGAFGASGRG